MHHDDPACLAVPRREVIARSARAMNLPLSPDELDECVAGATVLLEHIGRLGSLEPSPVPLRHPDRSTCRRPEASEDPFEAIQYVCEVPGSRSGPLLGMRIGVKDGIPVAGVPMTIGSARGAAVVPSEDAVVVERLLDAGAAVAATTKISWGVGDTRNPRNPRFSPGYSSAGSAAAVAGGLLDAAIGSDVAGSIRIPCAWCGLVGMKATHGLVPSYRPRAHGMSLIGPMTATVADNAAMLDVIAGPDWREPRCQGAHLREGSLADADRRGVEGLKIGVITESLEPAGCSAATLEAFAHTERLLEGLGATTTRVSIPLWRAAAPIHLATRSLSQVLSAAHPAGEAGSHEAHIDESLLSAAAADEEPTTDGALLLAAEHLRRHGAAAPQFARAQNLRLELGRQVDLTLAGVDLVITPTVAVGPFELSDERIAGGRLPQELLTLHIRNTAPFNLTGHPALTVPSGYGDHDLPAGLQIAGRIYGEYTVYRAAFAVESSARRRTYA